MTGPAAQLERAVSRDGTPIGFRRSGSGPGLVLVHGTTADASRWDPLLPLLEPAVTVYAVDRRGRGSSGDGPDYSLAGEAEDLVAVLEAIGSPVDVLGHSYGALCALEAARLTDRMRRLVLYEPAVVAIGSPEITQRLVELTAADRREEVLLTVLRDLVGMPEEQIAQVRALPSWANRVAAAHTVVREQLVEEAYRFEPERFAAVSVPTLMLAGSETPPDLRASTDLVAAALPDVRVRELAGQGHVAMLTAPELFVGEVLAFLRA
jgi:pimeloyl-ACP methyl ester carboxylesterase